MNSTSKDNEIGKNTKMKDQAITPELLRALNAGNQSAFENIYLHYVDSVQGFLSALTRSGELGKEMTQDVFVTLWEKREQINPNKNISGYIYTIAKNYAFKYWGKKKGVFQGIDTLTNDIEGDTAPDELLIQKEKEILIEIAVSRMPAQRRKVYELSRKEGLSNKEIAEQLNISKNTVENHITSALKDLREIITLFLVLIVIK